jgi:hypothetical protein
MWSLFLSLHGSFAFVGAGEGERKGIQKETVLYVANLRLLAQKFSALPIDHCDLVGLGVRIYFFTITSISILWHTRDPVQWVTEALFLLRVLYYSIKLTNHLQPLLRLTMNQLSHLLL